MSRSGNGEKMEKFRINVRTLRGENLCFKNVASYEIVDGLLIFTDNKTGKTKRFSVSNTEIETEDDNQ